VTDLWQRPAREAGGRVQGVSLGMNTVWSPRGERCNVPRVSSDRIRAVRGELCLVVGGAVRCHSVWWIVLGDSEFDVWL